MTRGGYQLVPIDYRILKEMTPEGTELAEFIPLGPSVKALAKRIDGIVSTQISGRLRILEARGMCVPIPLLPASQGRGWQRTKKGDEFLAVVEAKGVMPAIQEFMAADHESVEQEIDPAELDWENAEVYDASSIESDPKRAQERGE